MKKDEKKLDNGSDLCYNDTCELNNNLIKKENEMEIKQSIKKEAKL